MFDYKNKRMFLKKCHYPSVTMQDLYVGSTVNIYNRQLNIVGYGDSTTSATIEGSKARALCLIRYVTQVKASSNTTACGLPVTVPFASFSSMPHALFLSLSLSLFLIFLASLSNPVAIARRRCRNSLLSLFYNTVLAW